MILDGELLDVPMAHAAFASVLELRKGDAMANEALEELTVAEENWQKFAAKFVQEASASTDRELGDRALRVGGRAVRAVRARMRPRPRRTCARRSRSIRRIARRRFTSRGCCAARIAGRISASCSTSARRRRPPSRTRSLRSSRSSTSRASTLGNAARADRAIKRVLALDPAQPRALRVRDRCGGSGRRLAGVVRRIRPRSRRGATATTSGMLLQIGDGAVEAHGRSRSGRGVLPPHPQARCPRIPRRSTSIARTTRRRARAESCIAMLQARSRRARRARRAATSGEKSICDRDRRARRGAEQPREGDRSLEAAPAPGSDERPGAQSRSRGCIAGPRSGTRCST